MGSYEDREAFIPYRRKDIIEFCLEDGRLSGEEAEKFRNFCALLTAYYHFQFHTYLETFKENYAPFDPDTDAKSKTEPTAQERADKESKLIANFKTILERANYFSLSKEIIEQFLTKRSLIELETSIDFNDFEHMVCYCRGNTHQIISTKKFFKKRRKVIEVFERVALFIKFKNEAYFLSKKTKIDRLKFRPGKMYVYLYKNIPKFDLEFLFPNVKTRMTLKDRLLFGIPAVGAAIPLIIKVLPQLLLFVGAILFITVGPSHLAGLKISKEQVSNFMPVLVAILSLVVTMGGFAVRQYSSYKSKQLKFQKSVTETLFFQNIASNGGVFQAVIDSAEEEECKEIILVYYHLLTSNEYLTPEQLDNQIEKWMDEKFGTKIDFDINGPLRNLEGIRGKIAKDASSSSARPDIPLLTKDARGNCHILSLDDALAVLDYVWDTAFLYST
jgi:hypothetical protein